MAVTSWAGGAEGRTRQGLLLNFLLPLAPSLPLIWGKQEGRERGCQGLAVQQESIAYRSARLINWFKGPSVSTSLAYRPAMCSHWRAFPPALLRWCGQKRRMLSPFCLHCYPSHVRGRRAEAEWWKPLYLLWPPAPKKVPSTKKNLCSGAGYNCQYII